MTEEEVMQIRQRMMNEGPDTNSFHNSEEYKHKESLMEMKHKKESEKEIEEKLSKMQEKIKWSRPISKKYCSIVLKLTHVFHDRN